MLDNKILLITGGTGSFGRKITQSVLTKYSPRKLIVLSRDELKQYEMQQEFSPEEYQSLRFFIGDVRDKERLLRAFHGVDYIIHAAALKQVPAAEYNPFEAIKTNVIGTHNVIDAAIDCGVKKVIALSTDKAVNPVNLYGASKLCLEKLVIAGNAYAAGQTKFSVVRYGNVVGSRGSVIPLFLRQAHNKQLTITDERMTRFWITLDQGVQFVLHCLDRMHGGEVFVPKLPSMKITDLAKAICPECNIKITGIRPGEKISETLISPDEARHTLDVGQFYVITPEFRTWSRDSWQEGTPLRGDFSYNSSENSDWLSSSKLIDLVNSDGTDEF